MDSRSATWFKPGNIGRPAGTKNKSTIIVRNALLGAFDAIGGMEAFVLWAKNNPLDFYTKLWVKMLPEKQIQEAAERNGPVLDLTKLSSSEIDAFKAILAKMAFVEPDRENEQESQDEPKLVPSTASVKVPPSDDLPKEPIQVGGRP